MRPQTKQAFDLLMQGQIALSEIESTGIRIDIPYLEAQIKDMEQLIQAKEESLKKSSVWTEWVKHFDHPNLTSRDQLGKVLFGALKLPCIHFTATGRPKTDDEALRELAHPFAKRYLSIEKLRKAFTTYLVAIKREQYDGILHCNYQLNTARTYRSSASEINFQNLPVRNPKLGKIIRNCFIPSLGNRIVDIDYGQLEVRIAACYHKDPVMIKYIKEDYDLHKDMAEEIFLVTSKEVDPTEFKKLRYVAKNRFVFPVFYGSYYLDCSANIWKAFDSMGLKGPKNTSMTEHLKRKGIKGLGGCIRLKKPQPGTFEYHIQQVERGFWGDRFSAYTQWKDVWYKRYLKKGYFDYYTGFRVEAACSRNEVLNYAVQGSAFHCLLWSIIQINKWINKEGLKSRIVGQIHDSIIADVPDNELQLFLDNTTRIMTEDLVKEWDWINVPLTVEPEVTPINGSWATKEVWVKEKDKWEAKTKK